PDVTCVPTRRSYELVVEVGALFRMQTRRAAALGAERAVAAAEPVHVGRWAAHVGEAALETGHAGDALHLGEDRTLAARVDELALDRKSTRLNSSHVS